MWKRRTTCQDHSEGTNRISEVRTISENELAELETHGSIDLIDLRTPLEFQSVHATAARNVPLDSLHPQTVLENRTGKAEDSIYVICHSGTRGAKGFQKFIEAGFSNVVNVEGGTSALDKADLTVIRGRKSI